MVLVSEECVFVMLGTQEQLANSEQKIQQKFSSNNQGYSNYFTEMNVQEIVMATEYVKTQNVFVMQNGKD